jgi:hypothetical protein
MVIPDDLQVLIRPPQGGYVVLSPQVEPEARAGQAWTGTYELPSWYGGGSYTFRFLAIDKARNSFSTDVAVDVPEFATAKSPAR